MAKAKRKQIKKEPLFTKHANIKLEPKPRTAKRRVTRITAQSRITTLQAMEAKRNKTCRKSVMKNTMHNYKAGKLIFAKSTKHPKGLPVRNRKQALAIGLSYANKKC